MRVVGQRRTSNALIHRDLAVREVTTRIHIFDRAIEIRESAPQRRFCPGFLRAIRFGVQLHLNPQIASIFSSPAYGLSLSPGGIPRLLFATRKLFRAACRTSLPLMMSFVCDCTEFDFA